MIDGTMIIIILITIGVMSLIWIFVELIINKYLPL